MKQDEKHLLKHYRLLCAEDAQTLLSFAEFLAARNPPVSPSESLTVKPIERPVEESVIAAIRRLSATYPMLDKDKMLSETSALMAQHVVQGRSANEVIDELEQVFVRYYDAFVQQTD